MWSEQLNSKFLEELEMGYKQIENTLEGRKAPSKMYRLLLAGHDDSGALYHVQDYNRAELALQAAEQLKVKGWGIVHDAKGNILTINDGPISMMTYGSLMKTFGGKKKRKRPFTIAHADAIEKMQSERLPGWQKGDRMMVFWKDIEVATGAIARCGDF